MSLATRINFGLQARLSPAAVVDSQGAWQHKVDAQLVWASGTAVDTADRVYERSGTLAAGGANISLNLQTGLLDAFGSSAAMARVKAVYIENTGTVAQATLLVFGICEAITTGDGFNLKPGQRWMNATGHATAWPTTGAGDLVIENDDVSLTGAYRLIVVGASA